MAPYDTQYNGCCKHVCTWCVPGALFISCNIPGTWYNMGFIVFSLNILQTAVVHLFSRPMTLRASCTTYVRVRQHCKTPSYCCSLRAVTCRKNALFCWRSPFIQPCTAVGTSPVTLGDQMYGSSGSRVSTHVVYRSGRKYNDRFDGNLKMNRSLYFRPKWVVCGISQHKQLFFTAVAPYQVYTVITSSILLTVPGRW